MIAPPALAVRSLPESDVAAAAALHAQALPDTVNSRLGQAHLRRLYASMRVDPDSLVEGAWLADQLVGLVTATHDVERLTTRLMAALSPWQWLATGASLLMQPTLAWLWWISRRTSRPVHFQGEVVKPCLTAIVVAPPARRAGVGRSLVRQVDDFVRGRARAYHLDTSRDNLVARAFYARLGFVETEVRGPDVILVRVLGHGN
jgi:GNAT superfamily N-acetyltransferase